MRSQIMKTVTAFFCAGFLAGCLVSEEPILTAENGKAAPLSSGDYRMCPIGEDAGEQDCETMRVTLGSGGGYTLANLDENENDTVQMRFRRIGRKAYAVQQFDSGDDVNMYFYGVEFGDGVRLTLMMCEQLPAMLRDSLIASGDLALDENTSEVCIVRSWRGLKKAARAYHKGTADLSETITFELLPFDDGAIEEEQASE